MMPFLFVGLLSTTLLANQVNNESVSCDETENLKSKTNPNFAAVYIHKDSGKNYFIILFALALKNKEVKSPNNIIVCNKRITEEVIEDLDDLCDSEVEVEVLGRLRIEGRVETFHFVKISHLHIDSTQDVAVLKPIETLNSPDLDIDGISSAILQKFKADDIRMIPSYNGDIITKEGEEVKVEYKNLINETSRLSGNFCFDTSWDGEKGACTYERENNCSFCLFMKGGPCRKVFQEWEKCVDKAKEKEEDVDFVDECSKQTFALKDCVDMFPDYYYSLVNQED